ncbi:TlyA family RNA methyltransferase [Candidatus Daviesbacteria bacterium]|nr:TlyA family RNA methyltransferase [Candidatus Daviesbacteria bacterium]
MKDIKLDSSAMPQNDKTFVSRGGIKLQAALDQFRVDVKGKIVLDVGSSTGGFVDCLLQNGVSKVYALDTAYGELAWKLRNDPRVVVMERTNILHLNHLPGASLDFARDKKAHLEGENNNTSDGGAEGDSSEVSRVDMVTIDAGWTRLELILPVVRKFLKPDGIIIALLKPHYEAPKNILVKGVVPPESVENITHRVCQKIKDLGFKIYHQMESPILGGAGNKEFLLLLKP